MFTHTPVIIAASLAFWLPGPCELALLVPLLMMAIGFLVVSLILRPTRAIAASAWTAVQNGFTDQQVRDILGAPDRIEPNGDLMVWQYGRWPSKEFGLVTFALGKVVGLRLPPPDAYRLFRAIQILCLVGAILLVCLVGVVVVLALAFFFSGRQ